LDQFVLLVDDSLLSLDLVVQSLQSVLGLFEFDFSVDLVQVLGLLVDLQSLKIGLKTLELGRGLGQLLFGVLKFGFGVLVFTDQLLPFGHQSVEFLLKGLGGPLGLDFLCLELFKDSLKGLLFELELLLVKVGLFVLVLEDRYSLLELECLGRRALEIVGQLLVLADEQLDV
jgi:hypothetical protein